MTMQTPYSPKPKIFGDGYGKHVSYNYVLMKKFFWLGWKMLVNMFIPGVFYERAHWEVIDLYYKMQGRRHGTDNEKRCDECGGNLLSSDDTIASPSRVVPFTPDPEPEITEEENLPIGDFEHPEERHMHEQGIDRHE